MEQLSKKVSDFFEKQSIGKVDITVSEDVKIMDFNKNLIIIETNSTCVVMFRDETHLATVGLFNEIKSMLQKSPLAS